MTDKEEAFYVQCTGQVESGDFGSLDNMYCRYAFHFGQDWVVSAVSKRTSWLIGQFICRVYG
jgi:hypothetical protein